MEKVLAFLFEGRFHDLSIKCAKRIYRFSTKLPRLSSFMAELSPAFITIVVVINFVSLLFFAVTTLLGTNNDFLPWQFVLAADAFFLPAALIALWISYLTDNEIPEKAIDQCHEFTAKAPRFATVLGKYINQAILADDARALWSALKEAQAIHEFGKELAEMRKDYSDVRRFEEDLRIGEEERIVFS